MLRRFAGRIEESTRGLLLFRCQAARTISHCKKLFGRGLLARIQSLRAFGHNQRFGQTLLLFGGQDALMFFRMQDALPRCRSEDMGRGGRRKLS